MQNELIVCISICTTARVCYTSGMKQTQLEWVKSQLAQYSEITRNQCLAHNITRLSAIILTLKHQGYDFTTSERGGDYVYTLGTQPVKPKPVELRYDPVKNCMVRI